MDARTARRFRDKAGQLVGTKPIQPCPLADVGRVRHLGLHADEVLDRLEGGQPPAAQRKRPLQQRAV
jgi:hypothetical protein